MTHPSTILELRNLYHYHSTVLKYADDSVIVSQLQEASLMILLNGTLSPLELKNV